MSDRCIFCTIINRDAESYIIYEDERIISFLDKYPLSRGHLLVVTKKHYERLVDAETEDLIALVNAIKLIANRVERLSTDYNIGMNQGSLAGQIVPHIHFHIIPRYSNEKRTFSARNILDKKTAKELVELLS